MNKIEDIINDLCFHKISKTEAVKLLKEINDGFRNKVSFEFQVEEIAFTSVDDHGLLKLKAPYGYSKIKDKFKKGDKVDLLLIP